MDCSWKEAQWGAHSHPERQVCVSGNGSSSIHHQDPTNRNMIQLSTYIQEGTRSLRPLPRSLCSLVYIYSI